MNADKTAVSTSATAIPRVVKNDAAARAVDRERVGMPASDESPHLTVAGREELGHLARAGTPVQDLARWSPAADRVGPVELLTGQETSRVQELVPVRHARMATSAFAFYRGGALVMAADLALMPRTSLHVQLCGDAHLSNFGLFAAPDRTVVFDVNDFDETHPGPFEWDVKRLATSFILAARDNQQPAKAARAAAEAACASYRVTMANLAGRGDLDIWYSRVDVSGLEATVKTLAGGKKIKHATKEGREAKARVTKAVAKARTRDAWSVIAKITEVVDGHRQFRADPPLLVRLDVNSDLYAVVGELYQDYLATLQDDRHHLLKRYQIIDVGHKVVGVGSVGLLAFVVLLRGRDDQDLMVLQVKQAQPSVLEAFTQPSAFARHGQRVVAGQRLTQAASDSFLGWIDDPAGRSFYVRQLRDMKWSPDPDSLNADGLYRYALLCGGTLAHAHARSGDAVAISAYLGTSRSFDKALTAFAASYADQVERDYAAFTAAIADGRITAKEDAAGGDGLRAARRLTDPTTTHAETR
jgi:uncharacterized protein (DUF2252 family)